MNNQQFRRLVLDTSKQQDAAASNKSPTSRSSASVLGARKTSSIPMTPRQVGRSSVQADFARQLAERNAKASSQKKWKTSAPKGTRLAAGYVDRTKDRTNEENDELAQRVKNLEESMKQGELDRELLDKLVQELTGGDVNSTHLVRGLDRKLLERVRKGENVLSGAATEEEKDPDVDDQFEELENQEVGTIVRQRVEKKGEMAPPAPVAGVKRTRGDILAELKAHRKAATDAATAEHEKKYPALGPGFRKINAFGETSRLEIDARGREVLIVTGPDGKEKRKVNKQKVDDTRPGIRYDLDDPKNPVKVPSPKTEALEDDDDIFEGVGSSYNPLANIDDVDDSSSSSEEDESTARRAALESGEESSPELTGTSPEPSNSTVHSVKRDYFQATGASIVAKEPHKTSSADATVLAALKKVHTLDPSSSLLQDNDSQEARLRKRAAELAARDRDMEDIDMGFGGSRFDDAEEMEHDGDKVKFSEWKGLGAKDDEDEGGDGRGGKTRKWGSKKKKRGDKNSAEDVLRAMEQQKEKKTLG